MLEDHEIWTSNLTKVYQSRKSQTLAVDHIDLRVTPGIHGFLGPNGAGKTTTINMLVGAISITEGEAFIKGHKAGSIQARRLIGFLPQDPAFYGSMTALNYLVFMAQLFGVRKSVARARARDLLEFFGLEEETRKTIAEFSGGMKQKVGLASTLIHGPKLLILDEPTTNLDPVGRKSIIDYIKQLSTDMSIFVSSHILSEIEQMCEEVTILVNGKIVITDKIRGLKDKYSLVEDKFVLDTDDNDLVLKKLLSSRDEGMKKAWMGDDGKIYIITEERRKLQELVSSLIRAQGILINDFHQVEVPLQDVFIKLMEKE